MRALLPLGVLTILLASMPTADATVVCAKRDIIGVCNHYQPGEPGDPSRNPPQARDTGRPGVPGKPGKPSDPGRPGRPDGPDRPTPTDPGTPTTPTTPTVPEPPTPTPTDDGGFTDHDPLNNGGFDGGGNNLN
jgi:hypothetical protein